MIVSSLIGGLLLAGCSDDPTTTDAGSKQSLAEVPRRGGLPVSECSYEVAASCPAVPAPDSCEFRGPLPDPRCTPGALNPAVTQGTLEATLCRPGGYTDSVRPPRGYTDSLKPRLMAAYGVESEPLGDYELDHLIPLGLGGAAADPRNLWPEPEFGPDSASEKNDLAGRLNQAVCAGEISLAAAQRELLGWADD
jgi:hypothetical protein